MPTDTIEATQLRGDLATATFNRASANMTNMRVNYLPRPVPRPAHWPTDEHITGLALVPRETDHGRMWEVRDANIRDYPYLRPFVGMWGWYTRDDDITDIVPATGAPVATVTASPIGDIPDEYRAMLPENAVYGRLTTFTDGLSPGEFFAYLDEARGWYCLIAWPGHPNHSRFGARPNLGGDLRGWWVTRANFTVEVADLTQPASTDPLAMLPTVIPRDDTCRAVGVPSGSRVALARGEDGRHPCLVFPSDYGGGAWPITGDEARRYAHLAPFVGQRGWWVDSGRWTDEQPPVDAPDLYPVGHWFTWGGRVSWFRISRVTGETFHYDMVCEYDRMWERTGTYELSHINGDRFTCVAGDDPMAPRALREWVAAQAEPVAEPVAVGMRVQVQEDSDEPSNVGQYARLEQIRADTSDDPQRYRVVYEDPEVSQRSGHEYGWWVEQVTPVPEAATVEVSEDEAALAQAWEDYYADVPEQHRSQVPNGARWAHVTRFGERMLLSPETTPDTGYCLMWPHHAHYSLGDARREWLPAGWSGYRTTRGYTYEPEVPPVLTDRARMTGEMQRLQRRIEELTEALARPATRSVTVNVRGVVPVEFAGTLTVEVPEGAPQDQIERTARDVVLTGEGGDITLGSPQWADAGGVETVVAGDDF